MITFERAKCSLCGTGTAKATNVVVNTHDDECHASERMRAFLAIAWLFHAKARIRSQRARAAVVRVRESLCATMTAGHGPP